MKKFIFFIFFFSTVLFISILSFSADSSPDRFMTIPEAIWAKAAFGGEWATEIMIHDILGGSRVRVIFRGEGNILRGPFLIWDNTGYGPRVWKSSNILMNLQIFHDPSFNYYGKVGALFFEAEPSGRKIQVTAMIYHDTGFGKTMNAYNTDPQNYASMGSPMKIMNLIKSETYRSACAFFNGMNSSIGTVEFKLKGHRYLPCSILPGPPQGYDDIQLGSTFTKVFNGFMFMAFDPFEEAGVEEQGWCPGPPGFWQDFEYNCCYLEVNPISVGLIIYGYGATANNNTNDPAAIIPMKKY